MAEKKFALVVDGIVVNVVDVSSDSWLEQQPDIEDWVEFTLDNPAYIGGEYIDGFFYSHQPYSDWVKFEGKWQAPQPYPTDGFRYDWNENSHSWVRQN